MQKVDLTHSKYLQTLVENRRVFNLENCELNIYESFQQTYQIPLTFNDFVITSMIRGKKIMHLSDKPAFDYLPGETVIVPAKQTMVIDFPEAEMMNPTQCMALTVDEAYVEDTLHYLNNYYDKYGDEHNNWKLQFNHYHFANDSEISALINKLISVCSSSDKDKNIFADLSLKELLIRLLQSQHLQQTCLDCNNNNNQSRSHFVMHYIQEHLSEKITIDSLCRKAYFSRNMFFRWFKEQFGISPVEYINEERVKLAKHLLAKHSNNVYTVSILCGFSDVNYFIRVFRKLEGVTPKAYQSCIAD